jgi:transcriptional regulator with XRE-family HTH domain
VDAEAISQRIREARTQSGLTQRQLADVLEVHVRTIENYERGEINYRTLGAIAAATGRQVEWILHGEDGLAGNPATAEQIRLLRDEVTAIREQVERMIEMLQHLQP